MAPPKRKRGKKPRLQNPLPAPSSQDDEEVQNVQVEEEQLQEVSTVKTHSDDDEQEEDQDEEEFDSEGATPPTLKPKKTPLKPSMKKHPLESGKDSKRKKKKKKKVDNEDKEEVSERITEKKHPLESGKDSKRKKKKKKVDSEDEEEVSESTEKNKFQRIWSEEDEIVILKGMIKSKKKGVDAFSDLGKFLESIKKSVQVEEFSQYQLKNKIKRLKKKYKNNSRRAKGDEDPFFSKPHEQQLYTLMKELWGGENSVVVATDRQRSSARNSKSLNANDLDKKLRSLNAAALKLYERRLDLVRDQTVAILDAHKLSGALEHE